MGIAPLAEEDGKVPIDLVVGGGLAGVDHDHAHHPHRHLGHLVVVRVVHQRAMLVERPLVAEGLTGLDRRLAQPTDTIHAMGNEDPVPVHSGRSGELVGDVDPHPISLHCLQGRSVHAPVVSPALGFETGSELMLHLLRGEMKDLHSLHHLER